MFFKLFSKWDLINQKTPISPVNNIENIENIENILGF